MLQGPWEGLSPKELAELSVNRKAIVFGLFQLKAIQARRDSQELRDDIEGFEMVLNRSDNVLDAFVEEKRRLRASSIFFKSNLEIVEILKSRGIWDS